MGNSRLLAQGTKITEAQKLDTAYVNILLSRADSLELAPFNFDAVLVNGEGPLDLSGINFDSINQFDPNIDSALQISELALSISEDLQYNKGIAESLVSIGKINENREEYFEADQFYKKALNIYEEIGDYSGISNVQLDLGFLYQRLLDRETAIEYLNKALQNAKSANDLQNVRKAIMELGRIYSYSFFDDILPIDPKSYTKAIEIYLEGLELFEEVDDQLNLHITNSELGQIYLKQGKPEKALKFLFDASKYEFDTPWITSNLIGRAYLELGELENAKNYFEQGLAAALKDDIIFGEIGAYIWLGRLYNRSDDPVRAIDYFNRVLSNAETTGNLDDREAALEGLSEAYLSQKDYRNAARAFKRLSVIKDSLYMDLAEQKESVDADSREMKERIYENQKLGFELEKQKEQESRLILYIGLGVFLLVICGLTNRYLYIRKIKKKISKEKERSDEILLNILPEETAAELKEYGSIKAKQFDHITVLFSDFKGFSLIAEQVSPEKLVNSVDYHFKHFDTIVEKYGLEKIKTIGDAYMCAGGIPTPNRTHAEDAMKAAIDIRDFVEKTKQNPPKGIQTFEVRIGLNSGPVVAGVVGTKKFAYDIWGTTVNFAARMESKSEPGRINVSETTYQLLKNKYDFTYRGEVEVKNGQILKMYFAEVESLVMA